MKNNEKKSNTARKPEFSTFFVVFERGGGKVSFLIR